MANVLTPAGGIFRRPRGGRRRRGPLLGGSQRFLSTPSARRATARFLLLCSLQGISIHALREEGDPSWRCSGSSCRHISIHALREEGDGVEEVLQPFALISIHALREEGDDCEDACVALIGYFYPRPP